MSESRVLNSACLVLSWAVTRMICSGKKLQLIEPETGIISMQVLLFLHSTTATTARSSC